MELLALGCCALTFVAALMALTLAATLSQARRVRQERDRLVEQLPELGLVRVAGSAWHEGEIGGRRVAVRANLGASLGALGLDFDTTQFSKVDVLVAVDLAPIGGRISDASGHRRDPAFETVFFAELGARHEAVPEASRRVLVAWAHETDDPLLLVDRDHRWCSAGPALRGATVVLATSRRGPLDGAALRAWLDGVAARASGLGR